MKSCHMQKNRWTLRVLYEVKQVREKHKYCMGLCGAAPKSAVSREPSSGRNLGEAVRMLGSAPRPPRSLPGRGRGAADSLLGRVSPSG